MSLLPVSAAAAAAAATSSSSATSSSLPHPADDEGQIATLWPEVESAFDEVCRRIGGKDPKENRALRILLKRMQVCM